MHWTRTTDPAARAALDEIVSGARLVDAYSLEWIATAAHRRARDPGGVVALARANGCRVVWSRELDPGVAGMLLPGGVIVARRHRDRARVAITILHELAHHLLASMVHAHADVHALSLALLLPRDRARALDDDDLLTEHGLRAAGFQAPAWALGARMAMLAELAAA